MNLNPLPFDSITSSFDEEDTAFIIDIYNELLQANLTVERFENFVPHITYVAAVFKDSEQVENALKTYCEHTPPLNLYTTGLGIFTGESPVIYSNIIRTPQLNRMQQELSELLAPFMNESHPHFEPRVWTPHLTIGWANGAENLGKAIQMLCQRDFNREYLIDDITILFGDESKTPQIFELKG